MWPIERIDLLQILYDNLPDKSLVKTQIKITDVKQFSNSVEVHLSDGTVETGDMIIGADGVHTLMRSYMWDYAAKVSPGLITAAEKTCKPFLVTCRTKAANTFVLISSQDVVRDPHHYHTSHPRARISRHRYHVPE
jgi:2-polyprenyl-6-methoxyphenol hydroxylase-like FAD-dependent oxidoreductase